MRAEAEHGDVIAAVAGQHRRGAVNLVRYTRLRQHDLRELQNDLMDIGATSWATTEAHVRAKVHAARNVLAALRGDAGPWDLEAIDDALDDGDEILGANSQAIFGPMRPGRPTRIMVTLPSEAADAPELVAKFVDAGMDVARINCAHDEPAAWARMAGSVRAAATNAGRQVLVSMDLPGPKLRTGPIVDGPSVGRARVTRGDDGQVLAPARIWLTCVDALAAPPAPTPPARLTGDLTPVDPPGPGQVARIGCTLPEAITAMRPGDPVLIDDGGIEAVVESVMAGEATLRVARTKPGGQRLGAEKGINLPDTVLPLPALTAEDDAHLPFIAAHADMVAVSFVRTADDILHVLDRIKVAGADHLGLLVKIETRQGFENLPSILLTAMRHPRLGVMIARGDLAVEVGFERLSEVPRQILALCEAAHVPAIWATQVLETLAKTGQPSRAEVTDAAAAQRAECVMLNKGPYILDAIRALDDILARMGEVQRKSRTLMRRIHSWDAQ